MYVTMYNCSCGSATWNIFGDFSPYPSKTPCHIFNTSSHVVAKNEKTISTALLLPIAGTVKIISSSFQSFGIEKFEVPAECRKYFKKIFICVPMLARDEHLFVEEGVTAKFKSKVNFNGRDLIWVCQQWGGIERLQLLFPSFFINMQLGERSNAIFFDLTLWHTFVYYNWL